MHPAVLALALTLALLPSLAPAQQRVSIEELERQLEAKEAEQAAAQRRAAEARRRQQEAAEAERRRQEEAAAEARRLEEAAAERARSGFEEAGNGLLRDTRTGLLWTQSDNGSGVNWHQATAFCQSKGMRLPSIDELAAIYNRPGAGTTSCGVFACKVSPLFRLKEWFYWSGTLQGSAKAWGFNLGDSTRYPPPSASPTRTSGRCAWVVPEPVLGASVLGSFALTLPFLRSVRFA